MLAVAIGLVAIIAGLAIMTFVKAKYAVATLRWITGPTEAKTKRIAALALLPGLATSGYIIARGIAPPAAPVVGALVFAGVLAIALAILKMEGVLIETESETRARAASGEPPPSSALGRTIASLVGATLLALGLFALHIAS